MGIYAQVSWEVATTQDILKFVLDSCEGSIGGQMAQIVHNGCFSNALGVSLMENDHIVSSRARFVYRSFMPSSSKLQIPTKLKCRLQVCTLDTCDLTDLTGQCTDSSYKYTNKGSDYVIVTDIS